MGKKKQARQKKPRAERTVWCQEEEDILRKHREEWLLLKTRDERDEFCTRIGELIREVTPEKYSVVVVMRNQKLKKEWEQRLRAIKTWFNNHRGITKDKRVFKFERKIQLRNVIAHYKHDEIEDEVRRLCPGEKPGSRLYFKNYQKALANIKNTTTKQEMEFYLEKQAEWQSQVPPPEVQRKAARKYGKRAILNMHEVIYKQMGIIAITIAAHTNEHGQLGLTFHDYNKDLAGPNSSIQSFLEFNREACSTFSKAFGDWVFKIKDTTNNLVSTRSDEKPLIVWKKTSAGIPIFPGPILGKGKYEHLSTKRDLLRDFFRMHYRLASNKENASPPWDAMGKYPNQFFEPGLIPSGFTFSDPTRMKGQEVKSLVDHIRDYQTVNVGHPFSFKQVVINGKYVKAAYPKETETSSSPIFPIHNPLPNNEDAQSDQDDSGNEEDHQTDDDSDQEDQGENSEEDAITTEFGTTNHTTGLSLRLPEEEHMFGISPTRQEPNMAGPIALSSPGAGEHHLPLQYSQSTGQYALSSMQSIQYTPAASQSVQLTAGQPVQLLQTTGQQVQFNQMSAQQPSYEFGLGSKMQPSNQASNHNFLQNIGQLLPNGMLHSQKPNSGNYTVSIDNNQGLSNHQYNQSFGGHLHLSPSRSHEYLSPSQSREYVSTNKLNAPKNTSIYQHGSSQTSVSIPGHSQIHDRQMGLYHQPHIANHLNGGEIYSSSMAPSTQYPPPLPFSFSPAQWPSPKHIKEPLTTDSNDHGKRKRTEQDDTKSTKKLRKKPTTDSTSKGQSKKNPKPVPGSKSKRK